MKIIRRDFRLEVFVRQNEPSLGMENHRTPTADFFDVIRGSIPGRDTWKHEAFFSELCVTNITPHLFPRIVGHCRILLLIRKFIHDNPKLQVNFGVIRVFVVDSKK
ncbi:hypothetical protein GYA54_00640 [Candidatus Kuenenbacteria bacterium]|nr:hypothetical protein [Candidatus Kuenenbacteria bacterium]